VSWRERVWTRVWEACSADSRDRRRSSVLVLDDGAGDVGSGMAEGVVDVDERI